VTKCTLAILVALLIQGCASPITKEPTIWTAGLADIVSTELALQQGGVELNPLGYPGVVWAKLAATVYIENIKDCEQRLVRDRWMTSLGLGAAANNLLVYFNIWQPVSGLLTLVTVSKLVWDFRLSKDQDVCSK
jgi:hypothetical protein